MPVDPANDAIATLAELRKFEPLDDEAKYLDDDVLAVRDAVIEALERECRVSFIRREHTEPFEDSVPMPMVALSWGTGREHPGPSISAASVNAVVLDVDAVATLRVGRGGLVSRPYGGFGNVAELTYEQGYVVCPGRVARAVKLLTRDWLVENVDDSIPSRATAWSAGENTYQLVTAGVREAIFDLPEANAVVQRYRE